MYETMATIQDVVLSVPDVSCEHRVKTINGALGTFAGVETVSIGDQVFLRYCP